MLQKLSLERIAIGQPIDTFRAMNIRQAIEQGAIKTGAPAIVVAFILALWQLAASWLKVPAVVLPTPLAIARAAIETAPLLAQHAIPTALEVAGGFLAAAIGGIGLAALLAASALMRQAIYPSVLFFQLIPKVALAPLFVLWFGIGPSSRIAFVIFISFFPVVLATLTGLLATPQEILRLCRGCNASSLDVFLHVRFPCAMPMIFSGLKISATFAIVGEIVGEFISAQSGLGYLILFASSQADTPLAMAAIAVLCIVGLGLYGLVVAAERYTLAKLGER